MPSKQDALCVQSSMSFSLIRCFSHAASSPKSWWTYYQRLNLNKLIWPERMLHHQALSTRCDGSPAAGLNKPNTRIFGRIVWRSKTNVMECEAFLRSVLMVHGPMIRKRVDCFVALGSFLCFIKNPWEKMLGSVLETHAHVWSPVSFSRVIASSSFTTCLQLCQNSPIFHYIQKTAHE